jgi:hypothetical protein
VIAKQIFEDASIDALPLKFNAQTISVSSTALLEFDEQTTSPK